MPNSFLAAGDGASVVVAIGLSFVIGVVIKNVVRPELLARRDGEPPPIALERAHAWVVVNPGLMRRTLR
jgi:hypothetical protein